MFRLLSIGNQPAFSAQPTLSGPHWETQIRQQLVSPQAWQGLQLIDAVARLEGMVRPAIQTNGTLAEPYQSPTTQKYSYDNAMLARHLSGKAMPDLLHVQLARYLEQFVPHLAPITNTIAQLEGSPRRRGELIHMFANGFAPIFNNPPVFDTQTMSIQA